MRKTNEEIITMSNMINGKTLRKVQSSILNECSSVVGKTAGPYGSHSMILKNGANTEFSKDGLKVLKSLIFSGPLERSIHDEVVNICDHVVQKVGDGTTSAVQLAALIFDELVNDDKFNRYMPYEIMTTFQDVVNDICNAIRSRAKDLTIDDVRKICMISTNGNKMISDDIANIYKQFGTDVFIQVGYSNTDSSILKTYDGVIMNKGYSSPSFVNNKETNDCVIANPRIYWFDDNIETPDMIQLFMSIFTKNIYIPYSERKPENYVPTVIIAPSISKDLESSLTDIEKIFYSFDSNNMQDQKPPFCIITGVNDRVDNIGDITTLCGCPPIKRYINPDQMVKDIEDGKAPSIDTVVSFCGSADLATISIDKMKLVNPKNMFTGEPKEDGSRDFSNTYNLLKSFLEKQIEIYSKDKNNLNELIRLRKRLHCLTANFVEYLIGGVAASDREATKDLVDDAVLNCRSASVCGVGNGALVEGLYVLHDTLTNNIESKDELHVEILYIIYEAYQTLIIRLLNTAMARDDSEDILYKEIDSGIAYNIREKEFGSVLCSIETEPTILEGISKIITLLYTTNQAFLADPSMRRIYDVLADDDSQKR